MTTTTRGRIPLGTLMGERRPQDHDRAAQYGYAGEALYALIWWGSTANYRRSHD